MASRTLIYIYIYKSARFNVVNSIYLTLSGRNYRLYMCICVCVEVCVDVCVCGGGIRTNKHKHT